jgi:hypothetical protein
VRRRDRRRNPITGLILVIRQARTRTLTPSVFVLIAMLVTACGSDGPGQGSAFVDKADFAAAMVALPGGGLLFGERATGRVRRADADGRVMVAPVAEVDVSTRGQRGLLGLAVDRAGRVFAAWTALDGHLLVGLVAPGSRRTVWRGPASAVLAKTAPSGLAAPSEDELLVCSYLSRRLLRYRIADGRATPDGTLVDDCRLGVAVLADGRVVYATESSIRVVGS